MNNNITESIINEEKNNKNNKKQWIIIISSIMSFIVILVLIITLTLSFKQSPIPPKPKLYNDDKIGNGDKIFDSRNFWEYSGSNIYYRDYNQLPIQNDDQVNFSGTYNIDYVPSFLSEKSSFIAHYHITAKHEKTNVRTWERHDEEKSIFFKEFTRVSTFEFWNFNFEYWIETNDKNSINKNVLYKNINADYAFYEYFRVINSIHFFLEEEQKVLFNSYEKNLSSTTITRDTKNSNNFNTKIIEAEKRNETNVYSWDTKYPKNRFFIYRQNNLKKSVNWNSDSKKREQFYKDTSTIELNIFIDDTLYNNKVKFSIYNDEHCFYLL